MPTPPPKVKKFTVEKDNSIVKAIEKTKVRDQNQDVEQYTTTFSLPTFQEERNPNLRQEKAERMARERRRQQSVDL